MKMIMCALLTIAALSSARADIPPRPHVEPGQVQEITGQSLNAVDALLMAKSADLSTFVKSGNKLTQVNFQNLKAGTTVFNFTRQNCMSGGVAGGMCMGGAQLQVVVETKRQGEQVTTKATSRILVLK